MSRAAPSEEERLDWLRLARSETVGGVTFFHLLRRYGSAAAALEALPALRQRGGRTAPTDAPSREDVMNELAAGEKLGAKLLTTQAASLPPLVGSARPAATSIVGNR